MTKIGFADLVATVASLLQFANPEEPAEERRAREKAYLLALNDIPDTVVPKLACKMLQKCRRWPLPFAIRDLWDEIKAEQFPGETRQGVTQEPPDTRNPEERRIDRTRGSIFFMALNHQLGKAMVRREGIDRGALVRDTEIALQNAGLHCLEPENRRRLLRGAA